MIKSMGMEDIFTLMEMYMKGIGKTKKLKDKEHFIIAMGLNMLGSGIKTSSMGLAEKFDLIILSILEGTKTGRKMVMENLVGLMALLIVEISKIIKYMGRGITFELMENLIMGSGILISFMGMELLCGQMVDATLGHIIWIKSMEKALLL